MPRNEGGISEKGSARYGKMLGYSMIRSGRIEEALAKYEHVTKHLMEIKNDLESKSGI